MVCEECGQTVIDGGIEMDGFTFCSNECVSEYEHALWGNETE